MIFVVEPDWELDGKQEIKKTSGFGPRFERSAGLFKRFQAAVGRAPGFPVLVVDMGVYVFVNSSNNHLLFI